MHGDMGPFGFFPFGILGSFAALLFLAGLVLLAIWLFREAAGAGARGGSAAAQGALRESPLDILARRFAAGEIGAEEFQKARDLLRQA
jgi:uncharacterized membrane protein